MASRIASDGYLSAGYDQVSIDDCWEAPRKKGDALHGKYRFQLLFFGIPIPFTFKRVLMCAIYMTPCARHKGSTVRFPNGMKAVGDFLKKQGVRFGIYSDEGTQTCGGFPGSEGYEKLDADTFASWGVDYLKLVRREKGDGEEEWSIIASIVSHPLPF